MLNTEQRQIDLHLPTGWNRCTTEELEHIASAIIVAQAGVGRYHPFNWEKAKLYAVLFINDIEVLRVEGAESGTEENVTEESFLVRRSKDEEPWPITAGHIVSLCEQLNWITDDKNTYPIFIFPYPTLDVRCKKEDGRVISHHPSSIIRLQGPPPLLDGYTWREYRLLTDWMQAYMRHSNAKNAEGAAQAQREFLAILFRPKAPDGKTAEHTSALIHLTSDIFTGFSPVKWQVILFWWSSLMQQLAAKFPHVFKSQSTKQRPQSPWDFYNRVTATLADEYKTSEEDQRNESYSVTLQKLENIALKAAAMERLTHKK